MKAKFERSYPYLGGIFSAGLFWWFAGDLLRLGQTLMLAQIEFFSAIFDLSTILTGLLFSVYVLAVAPGGGFIEKIFTTKTFSIFRRYVIESMLLGAFCSLISLPLRSLEAAPSIDNLYWKAIVLVWVFATSASILAFFRVTHIFFVFASADNVSRVKR